MKARLNESSEIAPEVRHFVFETPEVERLEYTPGQFVTFSHDLAGKRITRAYSVASAPDGNRFELCLNRVKEGIFSPWLFEMKPGDEVEMRSPLGHFVPRIPFRDSLLVATGTGIAPFRSYLGSPGIAGSTARITLLFGVRYEEGILYRTEFEKLAAIRPGFRFLPTLTRPGNGWDGRSGRVQEYLEEALQGLDTPDVYICGLKPMVAGVRDILKARGFEKPRIIYEMFG